MKWYNYAWEGLQCLFGCIVMLFLKNKSIIPYKDRYIVWFQKGKLLSGFSVGCWIIIPYASSVVTIAHEYGHCIQSKYLGPLYLLLVGLPSIANNLLARVDKHIASHYYYLYPEYWADKLGGVKLDWKTGVRSL